MENTNKSESIVIIVFVLIIVIILGVLAYNAFSSTNNLQSNSLNLEDTNKNSNTNSTPNNVQTQNEPTVPNVTKPEVPAEPVETKIAEFSSNIYDKDENRVHNITLAISKINGVIVKKDETFSFNHTVGPMGLEQGFKEAIGFDTNGEKIKMPGGGMCQISSTIYNAALIANLEIVERHPHSRRVYYVPKDKDATVYYDTLDFKFKNTTGEDIKVLATNTNSNVTIILNKITSGT